jgi:hypothetical protein
VESLTLLEASPALQAAAAEKGWRALTERDFQRAVEGASGAHSAPIQLDRWPSVGSVDIMVPGRVALELKWCKSGDTLGNCAWDIAKLGCAIAEGRVARGLIAAGAPAAHWSSSAQGVELFTTRMYEDDDLTRRYESWWRFWCKDVKTRPVELPQCERDVGPHAPPGHENGVVDAEAQAAGVQGRPQRHLRRRVPTAVRPHRVRCRDAGRHWRGRHCFATAKNGDARWPPPARPAPRRPRMLRTLRVPGAR